MLRTQNIKIAVNKGARVTLVLAIPRFLGPSEFFKTTLLSQNKELAERHMEVIREVVENRASWRTTKKGALVFFPKSVPQTSAIMKAIPDPEMEDSTPEVEKSARKSPKKPPVIADPVPDAPAESSGPSPPKADPPQDKDPKLDKGWWSPFKPFDS